MAWISVKDKMPDKKEPVIYATRKSGRKGWFVGIAYWCVSEHWIPELECVENPDNITYWMPLPEPPEEVV